jgi:hypothetical protein
MALLTSVVPVLTSVSDGAGGTIIGGAQSPIFKVNVLPFSLTFPGTAYAITAMFFCNRSTDPVNLTIYMVPKLDSPSLSNIIIQEMNISPGDTFAFDTEKIILADNDAIWCSCDKASSLNAVLSIVRVA